MREGNCVCYDWWKKYIYRPKYIYRMNAEGSAPGMAPIHVAFVNMSESLQLQAGRMEKASALGGLTIFFKTVIQIMFTMEQLAQMINQICGYHPP